MKEAQLASGTATPTGSSPAQVPSALINTPGSRIRGNERLSTQRIDSTAAAIKGVSLEQSGRRDSRQSGSGLRGTKTGAADNTIAPSNAAVVAHPYAAATPPGAYDEEHRTAGPTRRAEGKTSAAAAAALQDRERRAATEHDTAQAEDDNRKGGNLLTRLFLCRCG